MVSAQISQFASYAALVILYFLFVLSFFTVAFFVERMIYFSKNFLKNKEEVLSDIEAAGSLEKVKAIHYTKCILENLTIL